jgi:micrococcal nuclease
VTGVLAVLLVTAACGDPGPSTTGTEDGDTTASVEGAAEVVRIVDGDTLVVSFAPGDDDDAKVRLIGIDTPESVKPNTPVECFAKEATAHLTELVPPGTAVRLERDVEDLDRYDRLLAYLFRVDDGLFVNEAMVADGYAAQLTVPPNVAYADLFSDAQVAAREAGRGLWSSCGGPHEAG